MKRFLAVFLMLAILLTGLTVAATAETKKGWVLEDGVYHYYNDKGEMVTSDWVKGKDGKTWYYLKEDGAMAEDELVKAGSKFYAFKKGGAMVANDWFSVKWTGTRYDGKEITGYDWYYAEADGALVDGAWKQINKKWYYFSKTGSGEEESITPYMLAGTYDKINGKWYAFKQSGEMVIGWGQPWIENPWNVEKDTDWVYANADGSLATGWKKVDGKWYYFWPEYPWMVRDRVVPIKDGKVDYESENPPYLYAFDKSGAMVEGRWYEKKFEDDSVWFYAKKDGTLAKGWLKDNGKWYYMDDFGGMWYNWMGKMSDGKTYCLKKNGEMAVGWYQFEDVWYFFKDNGVMSEKEWVKTGGKWYYLKEGGAMAKSETLTIDGKEYTFGDDGAMK